MFNVFAIIIKHFSFSPTIVRKINEIVENSAIRFERQGENQINESLIKRNTVEKQANCGENKQSFKTADLIER